MADTVRTIADLLTALFQDSQVRAISAQYMRDLIVSIARPESTLSSSASIAWDLNVHPIAKVTLAEAPTITLSNGEAGRAYRLAVIQDGTGTWVPTLAGCTTVGTPAWATDPGAISFLRVEFVGSTRYAMIDVGA